MPTPSNASKFENQATVYKPPSVTPNRRVPAWLLSLCLHTLVLLMMFLVWQSVDHGAGSLDQRTGGIVLVDLKSDATEYLSEGDVLATSNATASEQSPPPLAADTELPPDLPGLDSTAVPIAGVGDQWVESLPGADALIDGPASNLEIGGKVTTDVFGVEGTGSRFVYVFDRSKSMEGYEGRPMMAARQELLKSLQSLNSQHQFQIIFYNDDVTMFSSGSGSTLHFASDDNKAAATEFVNSMRGDRGTNHLRALKSAFKLGPDVIFLLTDAEGGFTAAELKEAVDYNRSGAVINAIEFGERRGRDQSLASISRHSGGQYLFKDIRTLQIKK